MSLSVSSICFSNNVHIRWGVQALRSQKGRHLPGRRCSITYQKLHLYSALPALKPSKCSSSLGTGGLMSVSKWGIWTVGPCMVGLIGYFSPLIGCFRLSLNFWQVLDVFCLTKSVAQIALTDRFYSFHFWTSSCSQRSGINMLTYVSKGAVNFEYVTCSQHAPITCYVLIPKAA